MGSDQLEFSEGTPILHYRLDERLGGGGMGVVYKAYDQKLYRQVAIKFLRPELTHDEKILRQFQQEAIAASNIDHPAICKIYSIHEYKSLCFLVMEFVKGCRLDEIIAREPLEQGRICDVLINLCDALHATHERGVIHRDIKPGNVMLCEQGQVKIMDFGMAKLARDYSGVLLFKTGQRQKISGQAESEPDTVLLKTLTQLRGTPAYMSPEQIRNEHMDHRTDIFALGVLCYELLTGTRPFQGVSLMELLQTIVSKEPRPVTVHSPKVDFRWQPLIRKSLSKNRENRYNSVKEMADDIESIKARISKSLSLLPLSFKPFLFVIVFLITSASLTTWALYHFSDINLDSLARPSLHPLVKDNSGIERLLDAGTTAWLGDQKHKAFKYFEQAALPQTNSHFAALLAGHLMFLEDRQGKGSRYLQQVNPDSIAPGYRREIAFALKEVWKGNKDSALVHAEKLLQKSEHKEAIYCAAFVFERCGVLDRAIGLYNDSATRDLSSLSALHLAQHYLRQKEFDLARHWSKKVLTFAQESGSAEAICRAHCLVGQIYFCRSLFDSAGVSFQKATAYYPRYLPLYESVANLFLAESELLSAEQILQSGLSQSFDPDQMSRLYIDLGKVYLLGGRFVDALTSFDRARALGLESGEIQYSLKAMSFIIDIYIDYGLLAKARLEYQELLKSMDSDYNLSSSDHLYLDHLLPIKFALDAGEWDRAKSHLLELDKIRVNSIDSYGLYLQYLFQSGSEQSTLGMASNIDSGPLLSSRALFFMAQLLSRQQRLSQAMATYQHILEQRHLLETDTRFYFKAQIALSELYMRTGQLYLARSLAESFLHNWNYADPKSTYKQDMLNRLEIIETKRDG